MGLRMVNYRCLFQKAHIPIPMVRKSTKEVLMALTYLRDACGFIQTGQPSCNSISEERVILLTIGEIHYS